MAKSDKFYLGSHIGSESYIESAEQVRLAGGNLVQIFLTKSGDQSQNNFKKYLKDHDMLLIVHSSYTHNLAQDWDPYSWWIKNLELEVRYAHELGAYAIVIHLGKRLDKTVQEAYNNMFSSLIYIHNKTKNDCGKLKLLLETSTGQGTEMCYKLEDLAYFYKKFSREKEFKQRIQLCVDTCHIFSAGYCLKSENEVKMFIETFEELIGIRHIALIHLNDCKVECGCQKDRHEEIGKGYIGIIGLKAFFEYFRKLKVPIVLETPGDSFKKEINMLLGSI